MNQPDSVLVHVPRSTLLVAVEELHATINGIEEDTRLHVGTLALWSFVQFLVGLVKQVWAKDRQGFVWQCVQRGPKRLAEGC